MVGVRALVDSNTVDIWLKVKKVEKDTAGSRGTTNKMVATLGLGRSGKESIR